MKSKFMLEAISLSADSISAPYGGPFGAVIVKNGEIIGRGKNLVTDHNDPTAHAEVSAVRDACQKINHYDLSGCEIYTSCEPCPMCLCAIYWARLDKIYYAANRKDAASIGFDDQYFYEQISKSIEERAIPMIQINQSNAVEILNKWSEKDGKIMY
jgi:guanine deaminase